MSLKEDLIEPAETISNQHVEDWLQEGNDVVGYHTIYFPEEILYSLNILPYRMRGTEVRKITDADAYSSPYSCSYVKCLLQNAIDGRFDFFGGVIIGYACDHSRRLFDTWRKAADDDEAYLPDFFEYYYLPHSRGDHATEMIFNDIRGLVDKLEEHFERELTEEKLRESIQVYNKTRDLLKELYQLRAGDEPLISGAEALGIVVSSTAMPKDKFNELLEEFLEEIKDSNETSDKPRLMMVGSIADDMEFLKLIESQGAVVVSDALCFGSRCFWNLVDENKDPLEAIVDRYWNCPPCPRMFGEYSERREFVENRVEEANVDGVILQNVRQCDLHGADNSLYSKDLEEEGIPTLKLEREYGFLSDKGRIKTRIQAFLERIR